MTGLNAEDLQVNSLLSRLPNELFELVLRHVDFPSIAALRATCRANANRCMSPAFKAHYIHQVTDLSDASLARLFQLSTHPHLGPVVKRLSVTAVSYDPIVWEKITNDALRTGGTSFGKHADLIHSKVIPQIQRLTNRRAAWTQQSDDAIAATLARLFTQLPSLTDLQLQSRVVDSIATETDQWAQSRLTEARSRCEMDWISLWDDCSRVLEIVTKAMGRCESTRIESLSVFDKSFGKIAANRFHKTLLPVLRPANGLKHETFFAFTAKLTTLNLGFSPITHTPETLPHPRPNRVSLRPQLLPINALGDLTECGTMVRFLQSTPNLESLTLYMYNTQDGRPVQYTQVLQRIADDICLPKLRRLSLRGMWCESDDMVRFLGAHPDIITLDFRNVHMTGPLSGWDRIFELMRSQMPRLYRVYLENLWYTSSSLLPLNPKNRAWISKTDLSFQAKNPEREDIVYARRIEASELKNGIELWASSAKGRVSGRGKAGPDTMSWIRKRKMEYGPPRCPEGEF